MSFPDVAETGAPLQLRAIDDADRAWLRRFIAEQWGAETIVTRGKVFRPHELPGFLAERAGKIVGVTTYRHEGDDFEVVTLDSMDEGKGIGRTLLDAVVDVARQGGLRRVWLITTNDNLQAMRFYQRLGWELAAIHKGAVERARETLKPEIPVLGNDGIPIRDEVELELLL